jgi:hypothetical protein
LELVNGIAFVMHVAKLKKPPPPPLLPFGHAPAEVF